jgi:transglutaminase-like putative cysteine protease
MGEEPLAPQRSFLEPGVYVDSDHPEVIAFARGAIGDATSDAEKTARLFRAVREKLRYDPYTIRFDPRDYAASSILNLGRTYCIPKAVLLAASARAVGLPARLGFADVKNHLSSAKLIETLGSDLFAWHGYVEIWVEGKPYKLTPAFNESLCARFGVPPLDFDPAAPADAMLQAFDGEGRKYMEYVADRGFFLDLPFLEILSTFERLYRIGDIAPKHDVAFHG